MSKHDILRGPEGTITGILPATAYPRGMALMIGTVDAATGEPTFVLASGRCDGFMTRASREGPGLTDKEIAFGFNTSEGEPEVPFETGKRGSLEQADALHVEGADYILKDSGEDSDEVASVAVDAAGTGFTSIPTVAFSSGGGTGAAGTATLKAVAAAIAGGGTGYTANDVLTISGGTKTAAITLTVDTVSSGVITAVSITTAGNYSVLPSNAVAVTGGTGTGATFNITWGVGAIAVSSGGTGYSSAPTVTISGGGGSGATATATLGALTTGAITAETALNTKLSFASGKFRVAQSGDYAQYLFKGSLTPETDGELRIAVERVKGDLVA